MMEQHAIAATMWIKDVQITPSQHVISYSGKWFEPRSIDSLYSVIFRGRVVLKRTVVGG